MILFYVGETSVGFHINDFQEIEYWGWRKDYDGMYCKNPHSDECRSEKLIEYIKREK